MLSDKIYNLSTKDTRPQYQLDYPEKNRLSNKSKVKDPTGDTYGFFRTLNNSNVPYNNSSLFIDDDWVIFKFNFHSKTSPINVFIQKELKRLCSFQDLKTTQLILIPTRP